MSFLRDAISKVALKINSYGSAHVTIVNSDGTPSINVSEDILTSISLGALYATHEQHLDGRNGVGFTISSMGHANNRLIVEQTFDTITWVPAVLINAVTNNTLPLVKVAGSYTIRFVGGVNAVRIKVSAYTSGTVIGGMTASTAVSQNIFIRGYDSVYSEFNSSSVQLAAGATFTGEWEADLAWQGLSQSIFSDQPMTVALEQSNDGITAHQIDTNYYDTSSTGNDGSRMYNLVNNYHRVKVTNTGAAPTTLFYINTYNIPNWAPIAGRSLTEAGNQRSEVPEQVTYRASFVGTPVATATLTLKGSASKTIKITKIGFSQTSTASTMIDVTIKRYSAIATGTPATLTAVAMDSNYAVATAVAQNWSVTPGTQTSIGTVQSYRYRSCVAADNFATDEKICEFGNSQRGSTALTLRGVSQWAGVDLSALVAGSAVCIWIEWIEY